MNLRPLLLAACLIPIFLAPSARAEETPFVKPELFKQRDGLKNVIQKLQHGDEVRIAYFGGSITEWDGWRLMTLNWLKATYPKAKIIDINASMGGTGTDLGIFRFRGQCLEKNPDLIFVEFAVNDREMASHDLEKTMEGVVRQAWNYNPNIDLCFVYAWNIEAVPDYDMGRSPRSVAIQDLVAEYYGIPSINVALKAVQMQHEGKLIYNAQKDPDGKVLPTPEGAFVLSQDSCHPGKEGHEMYAKVVEDAWKKLEAAGTPPGPHKLPAPRVPDNYDYALLVKPEPSMFTGAWNRMQDKEGPGFWMRKYMPDIYETSTPGAKMTFTFKGSSGMPYVVASPDGGVVEYSYDGQPPIKRAVVGQWGWATTILGPEQPLKAGTDIHTVTVTLLDEKADKKALIEREKVKPNYKAADYEGSMLRVGGVLLLGTPEPAPHQ